MDIISSPTFQHLLILSSFLILTQHFHLSHCTFMPFPPTNLQPDDRKVLLRIQKHFGNKSNFWNSSSSECCVYCFDQQVRCDFRGHVYGLALNSDPENLFGDIPTAIADLPFLHELTLTGPYFTGPIPPVLGKLSQLQFLAIVNTSMTGRIPGSLGRLKNLTRLNLDNNKFTNHLPKSLSQLTNVWELILSSNNLCGTIPDDFFQNMSSLVIVLLKSNRFTGSIPSSIRYLVNIKSLDLSNNGLTGPIPDSFGSFKQATSVWLNNNQLTGSIPNSMGQADFWTLDLSGNKITDVSNLLHKSDFGALNLDVSSSLLKFDFTNVELSTSLNRLNMSHNMIYGYLPKNLTVSPFFSSLDVSYNQLCGPISISPVYNKFNATSFAHNKCLCGAPLRPCK